ncbi:MAG: GntR family transcriptional regulator [Akkermansiaceae bacterium]
MKKMNASKFEKQYVRDQAAEVISEKIRSGAWSDHLPSERWLSQHLGVGRDQIHQAILKLREQGVISLSKRRNQIKSTNTTTKSPITVVFLTPQKLQDASRSFLFCLDHLRHRLDRKNIPVRVETSVNMNAVAVGKRLKKFTHQYPQALWILHRATPAVQQWFQSQDLPMIILGTASNKITAPYVDIDHQAAVRHAIGVMQRAGHPLSSILLLRPNNLLEGIQSIETSYRIAMDHHRVDAAVMSYPEKPSALRKKLTSLFRKNPNMIKGIIISSHRAAAHLNGWLSAEQGIVTGRDLSLICLADGSDLENLYPSVAYYSIDGQKFSTRIFRMINSFLAGNHSQIKQANLLIPDFKQGSSVC